MERELIYTEIQAIVKKLFNKDIPDIKATLSYGDPGLDLSSFEIVELIAEIENYYDIIIDYSVYFTTVNDIVNVIAQSTAK